MYKILIDSCGEFTEEMENNPIFQHVALKLQVGDWHQVDDETFDQAVFLEKVANCEACPKSACPSPEQYMQHFDGCDEVYIVTLSGSLSGSYNSAVLAMNMYYEDHPKAKIHVFDSCSASAGMTLLGEKIYKLAESGLSFEQVVVQGEKYKDEQTTFFVLDNLDTLRKNGRLTGIKSIVASTLNIKPVMSADETGTIIQLGQKMGLRKALISMCDEVVKDKQDMPGRDVMISYCNSLRRAEYVKDILQKTGLFGSIRLIDMHGVSTMYANDGGIIVAV